MVGEFVVFRSISIANKFVCVSDVTDHPEHNESVNYSLTIPQYDIHQRHNVTVPAISKGKVPSDFVIVIE